MRGAQLDLFAAPAPALDFSADLALARRVPDHVRFGTSSWTFPGWSGLVYPPGTGERELRERGLELYARCPLFGTVGIDRSYYRPLTAPELRRYAEELPPGFPCVLKAWSQITSRVDPRTRAPNPTFLDPAVFNEAVAGPLLAEFRDHARVVVLELMPLHGQEVPGTGELCDALDRFFRGASRDLRYAVELRNPELVSRRYLDLLRTHRVGHVPIFWERMPPLGEQLDVPGLLTTDVVVTRLLIPPGERYADKKAEYAPFNRIVSPQPALYDDVARLVQATEALGVQLLVIVNNKVEGSSPLTVRGLAERVARP